MKTTEVNNNKSEKRTVDYSGVWAQYGIDPRQLLGVDPRTLPGPQVIRGGVLRLKKYTGRKAMLWLMKNQEGVYRVTIRYAKTGRKYSADIDVIDQPGFRTLNETLQAACDHGYLRLRRDRQEDLERQKKDPELQREDQERRDAERSAVRAQEVEMEFEAVEDEVVEPAA
jgi:hypothetical protein